MKLRVIRTGGQTGSDQGGWKAAKRFQGLQTTGCMPKGWWTETPDGKGREAHPEFAKLYGAYEHPTSDKWPPRTRVNIKLADATIIFNRGCVRSPGTNLAVDMARELHKEFWIITVAGHAWDADLAPRFLADKIDQFGFKILNVAGNRASSCPGIGDFVEHYMAEVFRNLGFQEVERGT